MELLLISLLAIVAVSQIRRLDQGRRIQLLGSYLGKYQIEKHMETVTDGFLRALGEADPARREQIFALLRPTEETLDAQLARLVADLANAPDDRTQVSRLPVSVPGATKLFPSAAFDLREAMAIHARGIHAAIAGGGFATERDRAYTLTAELLLMQHTCHWYCRSLAVASARMLARHKTSHEQLVESVSDGTRRAYCTLVGLRTRSA